MSLRTMARMPSQTDRLRLSDNPPGRALLLATIALVAIGVVVVYSATADVKDSSAWYAQGTLRKMSLALAAIGVLLIGWRVDFHRLKPRAGDGPKVAGAMLIAAMVAAALVFVPGIGREVRGARRWIGFGAEDSSVGFQPSELIKLTLPIFLAVWLTRDGVSIKSFRRAFVPAVGLIALCAGLVVKEDLGTAVVIAVSAGATLVLVGVPWVYLLGLLLTAGGGFYAMLLHSPDRMARFTAMSDVWSTTNTSSYQPRESLLAILTGGWFGKGAGYGTVKLGYLPDDHTDFVFAALCEEWGFVGGAAILTLWVAWMWWAWRIASRSPDRLGRALAGAMGFTIGLQAVLHVGVDTVILPPTGMSLPFVSAGGTSLLLMAAATVLIVSVSAHPKALERVAA